MEFDMAIQDTKIVGDSFQVGVRFQRYWDTSMANAFFCGELGAGLFFVSFFFDFITGMVAGLLITGIFKSYFHIAHMGVPMKSWRAILRPDRSWISRGLIAIVFYLGFGAAHCLIIAFDLETAWGLGMAIGNLVQLLATCAALVVMTYQGFAMSHSTAISLWNTTLMPVSSLTYALTGGAVLTMALGWNSLFAVTPQDREYLANGILLLLLIDAVVLAGVLYSANNRSKGGKVSASLLLTGTYRQVFLYVVVGTGLLLPALILSIVRGHFIAVLLAAIAVLAGYYGYRVLIFKAGVYEPMANFR
jgi:formate-dependent nitrite reductase membrane component NrfD